MFKQIEDELETPLDDFMSLIMIIIHIVSGFTALVCGAVAILPKKGKGRHKKAGRTFFWSMIAVALTAIYLSIVNVIPFLFLIAIFSYYLTWTGYKSIHWKNKSLPIFVYWFDLISTCIVTIFGIVMVLLSVLSWFNIHINEMISSLKVILLIFGVGTLIFSIQDLKIIISNKSISKFLWMYLHIGRMLGAYIATFTAFLVVNSQYFPTPLISWLAPTILGTPLIVYWVRRYRNKLEPRAVQI